MRPTPREDLRTPSVAATALVLWRLAIAAVALVGCLAMLNGTRQWHWLGLYEWSPSRKPEREHEHAYSHARACTLDAMRTTVELDPDTEAAVLALRQQRGLGVSESVNELIRKGLLAKDVPKPYVPVTRSLGEFKIDISNISEALDLLEGEDHR